MKYLRIFEGFGDYYTEISEDDWYEWEEKVFDEENWGNEGKPFIDFPLNQFLMLRSRSVSNISKNPRRPDNNVESMWFLTNHSKYKWGLSFNSGHTGIMMINNVIIDDCRYYVKVWYCDDDWYMVKKYQILPNRLEGNNSENLVKYYKCDQFDGLVKLLVDKGFIK
jgi:hypothetical protein